MYFQQMIAMEMLGCDCYVKHVQFYTLHILLLHVSWPHNNLLQKVSDLTLANTETGLIPSSPYIIQFGVDSFKFKTSLQNFS